MASRNWLGWLMSCGLLVGISLAGTASAQEYYEDGGYASMGKYRDGGMIPGTPVDAYGDPITGGGKNPYWVEPTPDQPLLFSSGDPFQSAFRSWDGFFFRAEYLQLDYTRPGDVVLGAPVFGVDNPREPFELFDGIGNSLGFATLPVLDAMRLVNVPGARGTVGIPLIFGSFEANIFGMNTAQETFQDDFLLGTEQQPFLGTSTLVNGQVASNVELYNDTYNATFTSKLWSTEANIFFDGPSSNFFSFSPIVGFKYLDLRESLTQRGSFTPNPVFGLPTVVTDIDSYAANRVFAPQIGLRAKFENEWGAVMFDPKFGLGANVLKTRLETNHFRGNGDPFTVETDSAAQICPVIDLNLTGRLKLSQNISMTVGYNFIFVGQVTRPQDNIYYNDNGPAAPPGLELRTHREDIIFQGLTVGVELRRP